MDKIIESVKKTNPDNDPDILEFEKNGYINPSNSNTIKKFRRRYREYFKIFDSAVFRYHGRNPKYNADNIFGERIYYFYDIRREKEFVEFIVKRFYDKNPNPSGEMRRTFTTILHYHNLCWFGCYHGGKKMTILNARILENELEEINK